METDSSEAVVPVISKNEAVPLVEASKTHCGGDGGVEAEGDIKVKADTINEDTTVPSVRSNSDTEESMDMGIMQEPDHISRAGIVQSESEGTLSSEATGGSEGEEESSVTMLSPQAAVHPAAGKESSTAKMVARFFNVELKDTRDGGSIKFFSPPPPPPPPKKKAILWITSYTVCASQKY